MGHRLSLSGHDMPMTAFGRSANERQAAQVAAHGERHPMMKAISVGMLCAMASGAGLLSFDGTIAAFEKMVFLCFMAGTLGALAGYATFGAENIKDLCRQALGNIALACVFGPWLSHYVANRFESELTAPLVLVVAGSVGLGGVALVKKLGPTLLDGAVKFGPAILEVFNRLGAKKNGNGNGEK